MGEDVREELEDVTDEMIPDPIVFGGAKGVEVRHQKQFDQMVALMSQRTNWDASKMTVFQFYSRFEILKKEAKETKKRVNG